MRNRLRLLIGLLVVASGAMNAAQIVLDQNAIVNGNAEGAAGSPSGNVVAVPGWTVTGQFTAVQYGAGSGYPLATDPGPTDRGSNFFSGGPNSASSTGTQLLDVTNIASVINLNQITYTLSGWLGGFSSQGDNAVLTANFLGSTNNLIGSTSIGPVTASNRSNLTGLLFRTTTGSIPVGTTSIQFSLLMTRLEGSANDGYADNLSFVATNAVPEPSAGGLLLLGLGLISFAVRQATRWRRTIAR